MYGAIIGDIAGSTLEFKRKKNYDFQMFLPGSDITDDTIMTIAIATLLNIAQKMAEEDGYYFHPDVREKLISIFNTAKKDTEFGNARYARNLIEKAESVKSERIDIMDILKLSDEYLFQLTPEDFTSIATVKEFATEKKIGFYLTSLLKI